MVVQHGRNKLVVLDDRFDAAQRDVISEQVADAEFVYQDIRSRLRPARQRAVVESPEIAQMLWTEIEPHIGTIEPWLTANEDLAGAAESWNAFGCNPRSRLYRYDPGADFAPHKDIPWRPNKHTRSLLTVLLYLPHELCVGGETVVQGEVVQVTPWRIAIFNHNISHEGRPIEEGQKTVLRNDVLIQTSKS